MDEIAHQLRRTLDVWAVDGSLSFLADHPCVAGRAKLRQAIDRLPAVLCDGDHLRDDVACLAHDDFIADGNLLFVNEVLVVQHRTADGGACQLNRLKNGSRCQRTGSSHLNLHIQQGGNLFLRRVFKGDCPFRKLCSCAQLFALT